MINLVDGAPVFIHREVAQEGCRCSACRLLAPWIGSPELNEANKAQSNAK
jgi:hypothetical protein